MIFIAFCVVGLGAVSFIGVAVLVSYAAYTALAVALPIMLCLWLSMEYWTHKYIGKYGRFIDVLQ
jgi:hypothetical protein